MINKHNKEVTEQISAIGIQYLAIEDREGFDPVTAAELAKIHLQGYMDYCKANAINPLQVTKTDS